MSRQFVNVTWNDSAQNYDGSQQMNRHFNPNGSAATHLYADKEITKKTTKRSIRNRVSLADSNYDRLETISLELDAEFKAGSMTQQDYQELRLIMNDRLEKAWTRLVKSRPSLAISEPTQSPITFSVSEVSYTAPVSPRLPGFLAEIGMQNRVVNFVNKLCLTVDAVQATIKTVKAFFQKV